MVKQTIAVGLSMALLAGCSGNPLKSETTKIKQSTGTDTVPTWYIEPQDDTKATIFAAATGLADDLQFSVDKATHEAKIILADKLASTASSSTKRYVGDNGSGGLSATIQKTEKASKSGFKDVTVAKYRIVKKIVSKEGVMYRTYVLLQLDIDDAPVQNTFTVESESIADKAISEL